MTGTPATELATACSRRCFDQIYVTNKRGAWAQLLFDDREYRAILLTAYGNWSFSWLDIGKQHFAQFLAECDYEYLGKKFLSSPEKRFFDYEATVAAVKQAICELRKERLISKELAKSEWHLISKVWRSDRGLDDWCDEISWEDWMEQTLLEDEYDYIVYKFDPNWQLFWDFLWVPGIKPALEKFAC